MKAASLFTAFLLLATATLLLGIKINAIHIVFFLLAVSSCVHHSRINQPWIVQDEWRTLDLVMIGAFCIATTQKMYNKLELWAFFATVLAIHFIEKQSAEEVIPLIHSTMHMSLIAFVLLCQP